MHLSLIFFIFGAWLEYAELGEWVNFLVLQKLSRPMAKRMYFCVVVYLGVTVMKYNFSGLEKCH